MLRQAVNKKNEALEGASVMRVSELTLNETIEPHSIRRQSMLL